MALNRRIRWGMSLTLLALGSIGWFTLRPSPEDLEAASRSSFACLFPCGNESLRDIILNVLLFLPLGIGLRLWQPATRAWLLCLLTTCAIEFTQYAWLLGRDASLRDILTNALGGAIGVLLVSEWRSLVVPGRSLSLRLAAAAMLLWLLVIGAGSWLIRPALPRSVYWGQWAPELGQFDSWRGTLRDVRIGDVRMPGGRMPESAAYRDRLLADSVLILASVITGEPPAQFAPIASIFDSEQREIFVLGQRGRDLGFRIRNGVAGIELRGQMAALRNAFSGRAGDSVEVRGGVVRGAWVLSTRDRTGMHATRLPFSTGQLWSGLMPFPVPLDAGNLWLGGLWIAGLLVPAGYWLGRGSERRWPAVLLVAGASILLAGFGMIAGQAFPEWYEFAGALTGPIVGWLTGRWSVERWNHRRDPTAVA